MTDWVQQARSGAFHVSGFRFADGSVADLRLSYRTLGSRADSDDNVILMLHGTTGSGLQYLQPESADALFCKGGPLDIERYFIVLPDAIGHGQSSKPSDGLGSAFPHYTYGDMIEGQHRLLVDGLGIEHLRLVIGASMGGMQTWLWGERYPDMMDALMPIASVPERLSGRNLLFRRLLIDLVRSDPGSTDSAKDPALRNLGSAWNLFQLMAGSAMHMAQVLPDIETVDRHIRSVAEKAMATEHPVDVIWEFEASHDFDPAPHLHCIKAPLLAVNFADDLINPVELEGLERTIRQVPTGRAVTLPASPGSLGHQTLRTSKAWSGQLADLMRQTERRR